MDPDEPGVTRHVEGSRPAPEQVITSYHTVYVTWASQFVNYNRKPNEVSIRVCGFIYTVIKLFVLFWLCACVLCFGGYTSSLISTHLP